MTAFWAFAPALTILTVIAGVVANPLGHIRALERLIRWLEDRERGKV